MIVAPRTRALGHVCDVCTRLRALWASGIAGAEIDTWRSAVSGNGADRRIAWPPVPVQAVERLGHALPGFTKGHRWQKFLDVGIGRIASQTGDPHLFFIQLIEGFQLVIGNRPVITEAFSASKLEIAGSEPGEMS